MEITIWQVIGYSVCGVSLVSLYIWAYKYNKIRTERIRVGAVAEVVKRKPTNLRP